MTKYSFTARGVMPDGLKITASGHVMDEDPEGHFPPHSAFEKARALVEEQFPGIRLKGDKDGPLPVKSYPDLRALKKKGPRDPANKAG